MILNRVENIDFAVIGYNWLNQQLEASMSSPIINEDSVSIAIDMPKEKHLKLASVLNKYELFPFVDSPSNIKFYMNVSNIYLNNLILKKQQPTISEDLRKHVLPNCIIYQPFLLNIAHPNGQDQEIQNVKGNIQFKFEKYYYLSIHLFLGTYKISVDDFIWARLHYFVEKDQEWRKQSFEVKISETSNAFSFNIEESKLDTYLKSNFVLEIQVQKAISYSGKEYLGIRNEGNTCYMNSILQILYFIRPLRKIIVESKSNNQTIKALRQIFIELIDVDGHSSNSVEADQLIKAYGRFDQYPRKQQDIHQFLQGFLQELEIKNEFSDQLKQIWQGLGKFTTFSKEVDKPYTNQIVDEFYQLEINMESGGNTFGRIEDSLKILLEEDKVEELIDTDEHGKIKIGKSRSFETLPNVIFFNIKRYIFHRERLSLQKVLAEFKYPEQLDLGFLMQTPTGTTRYQLYAVTVHKGNSPSSGHYYSLINTSTNSKEANWYEFNDSQVRKSSLKEALSFSGERKIEYILNKEHGRFYQRAFTSEATAYLLVYMRNDKFDQYQSLITKIPPEWITEKSKQKSNKNLEKQIDLEIYAFQEKDSQFFDPFENVETLSYPFEADTDLFQQIRRIQKAYFGYEVGTIWKVSKPNQKITNVYKFLDVPITPGRIFAPKRGHSIPDYLLLMPASKQVYEKSSFENAHLTESSRRKSLGLVHLKQTIYGNGEPEEKSEYRIVNKINFEDFLMDLEEEKSKKGEIPEKEKFTYHWSDYCEIKYEL